MKKLSNYITLFLILTIATFSLSGCYNINNIDQLAYVVAIGLDVGDTNNLKISFQLSTLGSSSSNGSSPSSDNPVINTIECSSIHSGITIINSYLSKEVNLSHCKVVVFSEALAYQGIGDYVYTLMNNVQVRPDTNIIVSRCSAEYFLNNSKPILENIVSKYYETAPTSSEYTGYTENVTLNSFFSNLTNTYTNPVAILGGVNTPATHNNENSLIDSEKDSNYKANETAISSKPNIETMGLAVFHDDVLVGELNSIETLCHMIVTNKLDRCTITIPSPFEDGKTIGLSLKRQKNTKNNVKLVNGSAFIKVKTAFEARIISTSSNSEYLTNQNIEKIEEYANCYLEEHLLSYFYKTSREFNADIDGFGKHLLKNFLYWQDWKDFNWLSNYKNSFFEVDADVQLLSGILIMQT